MNIFYTIRWFEDFVFRRCWIFVSKSTKVSSTNRFHSISSCRMDLHVAVGAEKKRRDVVNKMAKDIEHCHFEKIVAFTFIDSKNYRRNFNMKILRKFEIQKCWAKTKSIWKDAEKRRTNLNENLKCHRKFIITRSDQTKRQSNMQMKSHLNIRKSNERKDELKVNWNENIFSFKSILLMQ